MRWIAPFVLSVLVALTGFAGPAVAQIEGRYESVGPVPEKHSLQKVRVEEFLNFTCPHCNNFRQASEPLKERFGDRLEWIDVPVLFPGQSDEALRLYYIAERAGEGDRVKAIIFDATFQYGVNINDPAVVNYLAKTAGLGEQYKQQRGEAWVTEKVQGGQQRAMAVGVTATPTILLAGALRSTPETGMDAFIKNMEQMIEQLLRKQG